jgi:hypothetical protein
MHVIDMLIMCKCIRVSSVLKWIGLDMIYQGLVFLELEMIFFACVEHKTSSSRSVANLPG